MGYLAALCQQEGIKLISKETACRILGPDSQNDAGWLLDDGRKEIIIFNTNAGRREQQFTVAHELGHSILGHLRHREGASKVGSEIEADIFASVLLALVMFKDLSAKEASE